MSRDRTFRPRISREERDRVYQLAERLNGAEVTGGFPKALRLLLRWFTVITENVEECPECGSTDLQDWFETDNGDTVELPNGKWYCPECGDPFDAWDYVGVDDREEAEFPIFRESIRYSWEADDKPTGNVATEVDVSGTNPINDSW